MPETEKQEEEQEEEQQEEQEQEIKIENLDELRKWFFAEFQNAIVKMVKEDREHWDNRLGKIEEEVKEAKDELAKLHKELHDTLMEALSEPPDEEG